MTIGRARWNSEAEDKNLWVGRKEGMLCGRV
jgi:hypothetical protein